MEEENSSLSLIKLKKQIPADCFNKSLAKSLFYMIQDLLLLSSCFLSYDFFSTSWFGLLLYWNLTGFFMWCLFVVGHDCGHGSFSKYPLVNSICGHICHTLLFVPFYPWAYSHRQHHQFHNHIEKDKSHPWFTEKDYLKLNRFERWYLSSFIAPFTLFAFYLYLGFRDGSHLFPFSKMYRDASRRERVKCLISNIVLIFCIYLFTLFFSSWSDFFLRFGAPWTIFIFWLFLVTYLHHHDETPVVFDDSNWDFLSGALQTIDRKFCWGIDSLHHHITDGHLVHHLFFTQIPHYNLLKATKAIQSLISDQYKFKKNRFFLFNFWKTFFHTNFIKWTIQKTKSKSKNI